MRRSVWLIVIWVLSLALIASTGDNPPSNGGGVPQQPELVGSDAQRHVPADIGDPEQSPTGESDDDHPAVGSERERRPTQQSESGEVTVDGLELVSPLTGSASPANTESRWNIAGTDNGFSFKHEGDLYVVFGDTWGSGGIEAHDWRSNTMGIVEKHPVYGYILTDVIKNENGDAKELLESLKEPGIQYTVMPTSGISIDGRMYLHYMDIRDWRTYESGYKEPVVNGAGFAYSDDDGQTWTKLEPLTWEGDSAFTQTAMVSHGAYVYVYGTPAGRFGALSLFRVQKDDLLDKEQYEYWTGDGWSDSAQRATEIVPAPVGELSVRWSAYYQRWLMMYRNEEKKAIVLRTAKSLVGPWDEERVVTTSSEYPRSYGPFMLPIEGREVHFLMSVFLPDYQVYVMRMTLSQ